MRAGRLHLRCSWAPLPACAQTRTPAGIAMQPNHAFAGAGIENPAFQASENVADAIAVEMPLAPPHPGERAGSKMKKFVGHQRLQFAQVRSAAAAYDIPAAALRLERSWCGAGLRHLGLCHVLAGKSRARNREICVSTPD